MLRGRRDPYSEDGYEPQYATRRPGCGRIPVQFILPIGIALVSYCNYATKSSVNPVTGEKQKVDLTVDQEIALGIQSAPEMAREFGGEDPDPQAQLTVDQVGYAIVERSDAGRSAYRFDFHLLNDRQTVNAFALPGGQIFITRALYDQLKSPGQLAGVLGHEIGHVIARHGAEHLAKQKLTSGLISAVVVGSGYGGQAAGSVAQMVGSLTMLKHGRNDELESDSLGVKYMAAAGYHPESMIDVMEILKRASGGGKRPDFSSSHPNPENRKEQIRTIVKKMFPNGVPTNLMK